LTTDFLTGKSKTILLKRVVEAQARSEGSIEDSIENKERPNREFQKIIRAFARTELIWFNNNREWRASFDFD